MNTNSNINTNISQINHNLDDLYIKYEEIFKNILLCLIDDNQETDSQGKLEKLLMDFDKIIDEECLNRIKNTHLLNANIISNYKQRNNLQEIPFNQNKYIKYDDLITKIKTTLSEFNINR